MTTNGIVMLGGRLLPNRAYQVSVATPFHAINGQGYLNGVMSINIILKNKKSEEIDSSSTILLRTGRNKIFLKHHLMIL